jgi:hypothetical protein
MLTTQQSASAAEFETFQVELTHNEGTSYLYLDARDDQHAVELAEHKMWAMCMTGRQVGSVTADW